jgi:hypothetical protein
LPAALKAEATADVLRWAGVSASAQQQAKALVGPQFAEDPILAEHPRL